MCLGVASESAKTVARNPSGNVTVSGAAIPPAAELAATAESAEPGTRPESPQANMAIETKGRAARAKSRMGVVMQASYTPSRRELQVVIRNLTPQPKCDPAAWSGNWRLMVVRIQGQQGHYDFSRKLAWRLKGIYGRRKTGVIKALKQMIVYSIVTME